MQNREFLQLAEVFDKKYRIGGWFLSEKLDGMRAIWDGGISRGLNVEQVPFCNLEKSGHGKIATGLWSRYGHPIFAPDYFLDALPNFAVDGELWWDRNKFQATMSTVKDHVPGPNWKYHSFQVFDAVPLNVLFKPGKINNPNYKMIMADYHCNWAVERLRAVKGRIVIERPFETQYEFLKMYLKQNEFCKLLPQEKLPYNQLSALDLVYKELAKVKELGAEGLILRNNQTYWIPKRHRDLLKVKERLDAEATVVGYNAAELGKIHGKIGSLICRFGETVFNLSGLTDEEREFANSDSTLWAISNPGATAPEWVKSKHFPRGKVITFTYSELTIDGVPHKAAFKRDYQ